MKKRMTIWISIFVVLSGSAQDVHFSQYDRNPANLNPGLVGQMDGWMRASMHYNSQWSALGNPYKTTSFSIDMPFFKARRGAYLGGGINVIRDKAGDSEYGFTNIGATVSGILPIGELSELSLGIRSAFVQRSMSSTNLQWDSQFDGTGYNASYAGEGISVPSFYYFDFNTGMNYHFERNTSTLSSNDRISFDLGGAYAHISSPELQFAGSGDRLPSRINGYFLGYIGISGTRFYVTPQVLYSQQALQREIVAGSYVGYKIVEDSKTTGFVRRSSLAFGAVYRYKDAISPGLIYELADFSLQVSYDINVSSLSPYTMGRGGLEISVTFIDHLGILSGKGPAHKTLF